MGDTTTNRGYRKPQSTDSAASLTDYWRNLADDIDADVHDNIVTPRDAAWTDCSDAVTWTATTNPAIGDGSITARYQQIGKTVHYAGQIVMGSTSTFGSGNWSVSLPVAGLSGIYVGVAALIDASTFATRYPGAVELNGTTMIRFYASTGNLVNATNPFTWTGGDILKWMITYETA